MNEAVATTGSDLGAGRRRARHAVVRVVRGTDSDAIGRLLRRFGLSRAGRRSLSRSAVLRKIVEALLPSDPLVRRIDLPLIELVIPCHGKDERLLRLAILAALRCSRNRIDRVRLVTPSGDFADLGDLGVPIIVQSDLDLVGRHLLDCVIEHVPAWRRGWAVQQLVKLQAVANSDYSGCLVLDADTILLQQRTWLTNDGTQTLIISDEYHEAYVEHADRVWRFPRPPVSFVTHHQLMQPAIVRQMFPNGGADLEEWIARGDWREGSPVAEYHDYGAWMIERFSDRAVWARWRNRLVRPSDLRLDSASTPDLWNLLALRFPDSMSVSLHDHLR